MIFINLVAIYWSWHHWYSDSKSATTWSKRGRGRACKASYSHCGDEEADIGGVQFLAAGLDSKQVEGTMKRTPKYPLVCSKYEVWESKYEASSRNMAMETCLVNMLQWFFPYMFHIDGYYGFKRDIKTLLELLQLLCSIMAPCKNVVF